MSSATEAFFRRSISLGFGQVFPGKPASLEAVVDFMEGHLVKASR